MTFKNGTTHVVFAPDGATKQELVSRINAPQRYEVTLKDGATRIIYGPGGATKQELAQELASSKEYEVTFKNGTTHVVFAPDGAAKQELVSRINAQEHYKTGTMYHTNYLNPQAGLGAGNYQQEVPTLASKNLRETDFGDGALILIGGALIVLSFFLGLFVKSFFVVKHANKEPHQLSSKAPVSDFKSNAGRTQGGSTVNSRPKRLILYNLARASTILPPLNLLGAWLFTTSEGAPFQIESVVTGQLWPMFMLWPFAAGYWAYKANQQNA